MGDVAIPMQQFATEIKSKTGNIIAGYNGITADTEGELQKMLECVENWCKKRRLEINIKKTKVNVLLEQEK